MEPDDLAPAQRRHVVPAERGYRAFVPPPLPPTLEFNAGLVSLLSEADRALGQLAGVGRTLPNPHLLAHSLVRREAVLSSRIEGTRAGLSELVLFEAENPAETTGDVREVFNYVAAVERVLDPERRLPLSSDVPRIGSVLPG